MSKKVLVTWIIALLFLGIAIGTQAEGTEIQFFSSIQLLECKLKAQKIRFFPVGTGVAACGAMEIWKL